MKACDNNTVRGSGFIQTDHVRVKVTLGGVRIYPIYVFVMNCVNAI